MACQTQNGSAVNPMKIQRALGKCGLEFYLSRASRQRAKKVVSDSPGLVDFAIGLVNSVLNLPDGQGKILLRSKITEVL